MVGRVLKRPAEQPAERNAKRAAVPASPCPPESVASEKTPKKGGPHGVLAEKCSIVCAALTSAKKYPESIHESLATMAESCLCVPQATRHPFQTSVVEMIGEVLASAEEELVKAIATFQTKLDGCANEQIARAAASEEAKRNLVILHETVAVREVELRTAAEIKDTAKAAHEKAKEAQIEGDIELDLAASQLEELEKSLTGTYKPLKEGTMDTVEKKTACKRLLRLGKQSKFDDSMMSSATTSLMKAPEARTSFDSFILTELESAFENATRNINKTLAEGRAGKEERAAVVAAAQAALNVQEAKFSENQTALADAVAQEEAGIEAERLSAESVQLLLPEMKEAMYAQDAAKSELSQLRSGALATFEELKNLVPPPVAPPVSREPEAAEAESAEGEAAEGEAAEGEAAEAASFKQETLHGRDDAEDLMMKAPAAKESIDLENKEILEPEQT